MFELRLALGIEYEGTEWSGWQSQPSRNTVQDHFEEALEKFSLEKIKVICAGRTDAGVHAKEQVVHFDTNLNRERHSWLRGINSFLPASINVKWVKSVPSDFHARFSAKSRKYSYSILNQKVRSSLNRNFTTWIAVPLDHNRISDAAKLLLGVHDFSAFRSSECQAKSAVRQIIKINVEKINSIIRIEIEANAFLHHMVRNIVGCFFEIGRGEKPVAWIKEVIDSRDRSICAKTFPPEGLCLEKIDYGDLLNAN